MRWPFACALHALAKTDPKMVLLMGDVGGGLFKDFERDYPDRYFNLGTAEQTMVGIAAGLALSGFHPVVYTFTPFILERAFEQIKIDVDSNRAPVLLCGWTDTTQGLTHAALNPEALIGCFNHVELLAPKDKAELDRMLSGGGLFDGPKFLLLKPL